MKHLDLEYAYCTDFSLSRSLIQDCKLVIMGIARSPEGCVMRATTLATLVIDVIGWGILGMS